MNDNIIITNAVADIIKTVVDNAIVAANAYTEAASKAALDNINNNSATDANGAQNAAEAAAKKIAEFITNTQTQSAKAYNDAAKKASTAVILYTAAFITKAKDAKDADAIAAKADADAIAAKADAIAKAAKKAAEAALTAATAAAVLAKVYIAAAAVLAAADDHHAYIAAAVVLSEAAAANAAGYKQCADTMSKNKVRCPGGERLGQDPSKCMEEANYCGSEKSESYD